MGVSLLPPFRSTVNSWTIMFEMIQDNVFETFLMLTTEASVGPLGVWPPSGA